VESPRIAFLPLIRTTFDVPFAEALIRQARECLLAASFTLWEPEQPVSDLTQAQAAARALADQPVDMLLIFQATFADSSLVTALAEQQAAPIFLWAVPEPWSGERLRLNSLCGINLAGHALSLRGIRYAYGYSAPGDEPVLRQVRALAAAGALQRRLRITRLGVVGEHPAGLDSCHLDETALLDAFGVQVRKIALEDVFTRVRNVPGQSVTSTRAALEDRVDGLATLEPGPLSGTLRVYHALRELAQQEGLDGLAVRCWPEFFTQLGCAACGALSMLSDGFEMDGPLPCSCEADINSALTQWILQQLSGCPAFGTDIVGIDPAADQVAVWHCGLAPLSMAAPGRRPLGALHSNRKLPLVMDFALKPGIVTLARVSRTATGLRLVLGRGEMLAGSQPFRGTAGVVRVDGGAQPFLDRLMRHGLEHHLALTYGDYTQELIAFARLIEMPVLRVDAGEPRDL